MREEATNPWDLLDRYLAGESSDEERREVEALLNASPDARHAMIALRSILEDEGAAPSAEALVRVKEKLLEGVRHEARGGEEQPRAKAFEHRTVRGERGSLATQRGGNLTQRTARQRRFPRATLYLALVALVIAAGAIVRNRVAETRAPVEKYATRSGERLVVRLSDGSRIVLGPSTQLRVTERHAEVSGQAQFTIAPDAEHPFVVMTRNSVVQVLGTTFDVRQYAGEATSRIVVEVGKVSVRPRLQDERTESALLTSRMMGQVNDSTVVVRSNVAIDDYAGWISGRLVFNGEALRDVVRELSRAYGKEIRVADSTLAAQPMIMSVVTGKQSLTQVLDIIGMVNQAHYTHVGSAYVLSAGRAAQPSEQAKPLGAAEVQYGR